jgi:hypothetical protein
MPEKPFGIDIEAPEFATNPLDLAGKRKAQKIAERARLIAERKEFEKLLPYSADENLLGWFAKQRAAAVEALVKAASADGRIYCQAAVRTIDGLVEEIKSARKQFERWSDLIDAQE